MRKLIFTIVTKLEDTKGGGVIFSNTEIDLIGEKEDLKKTMINIMLKEPELLEIMEQSVNIAKKGRANIN